MPKATMEEKTFHGPVAPDDFARALVAEFDQGNLTVRQLGRGAAKVVQIASAPNSASGGKTAITIQLTEVEDGVHVRVGQQDWFGVAASLGLTALSALRRPALLLSRLDDLAQDIASLQLTTRIWQTIASTAEALGVSQELSERLRRLSCPYCHTANPVGAPSCVACGAPLGPDQPRSCPECGYIVDAGTQVCPRCSAAIG
jgi:hypothetical protein